MFSWKPEVKVIYVPSKELKKDGTPKLIKVEHRKLFLTDTMPIGNSGFYRIVCKTSKLHPPRFTVSVIRQIEQNRFQNPDGSGNKWFKLAPDRVEIDQDGREIVTRPYVRTNDAAMNTSGILNWLTKRMGLALAENAFNDLLMAEAAPMLEAA